MNPLRIPGAPELIVIVLVATLLVLVAIVGGFGYFLLRVRSGGSVDERLDRIERKIGRLEPPVEYLRGDGDTT